jgi:hypothetical protein
MANMGRISAMAITTKAMTIDEFVALFSQLCDERSCFIPSAKGLLIGSMVGVSIRLADGSPMIEGLFEVIEVARSGVRLGYRAIAPASTAIVDRLVLERNASATIEMEPVPEALVDERTQRQHMTMLYGAEPLVPPRRRTVKKESARTRGRRLRMRALTVPPLMNR